MLLFQGSCFNYLSLLLSSLENMLLFQDDCFKYLSHSLYSLENHDPHFRMADVMTCASCQESITDRAMKAKDQVMPIMMICWMYLLYFRWNKAVNVKITWHLPPEITTNISVLPRAPFCLLWMPGKLAECPSLHQVRFYWLFSTLFYFFSAPK